eukprot:scaffold1603_cov415-Prasinococcus_capsulatus_cf.AAC.10
MGFTWWMQEYPFVSRTWEKDQATLVRAYHQLLSYPDTPEDVAQGTRFSKEKLETSQAVAQRKGLPIPKRTLLPRPKGFALAAELLRSRCTAIYDVTLAFPSAWVQSLAISVLWPWQSMSEAAHMNRLWCCAAANLVRSIFTSRLQGAHACKAL